MKNRSKYPNVEDAINEFKRVQGLADRLAKIGFYEWLDLETDEDGDAIEHLVHVCDEVVLDFKSLDLNAKKKILLMRMEEAICDVKKSLGNQRLVKE